MNKEYTAITVNLSGWIIHDIITYLNQKYGESHCLSDHDTAASTGIFIIKGKHTIKEGHHTVMLDTHNGRDMVILSTYESDVDGNKIGSETE